MAYVHMKDDSVAYDNTKQVKFDQDPTGNASGGSVQVSTINGVIKTSSCEPVAKTGSDKKVKNWWFQVAFFLIVVVAILTSVIAALLIVKLNAEEKDAEILKALLNKTETMESSIRNLEKESAEVKRAGALRHSSAQQRTTDGDNDDTKLDLIVRQTANLQTKCTRYSGEFDCPSRGIAYNGFCYFIIDGLDYHGNFEAAKEFCRHSNAYPAFIEDELTYEVLYDYLESEIKADQWYYGYYWLGERYDMDSGKVYFLDGRESTLPTKWITTGPFPIQDANRTQIVWWIHPYEDESVNGFGNSDPTSYYDVLCQRPW